MGYINWRLAVAVASDRLARIAALHTMRLR